MFVDLLILGLGVLTLLSDGEDTSADTGYIEYTPGNTNLIITSPHDGHLTPESIPDRTPGCKDSSGVCQFPGEANCPQERICKVVVIPDRYSLDMAQTFREVYIQRTGKIPHMIVNRLHRSKLDTNREMEDAAQSSESQEAWRQYHGAIKKAKESFNGESGLLLDFHRQRHGLETTELGYVYTKDELNAGNLDSLGPISSISSLLARTGLSAESMMSGPESLGAAWEEAGYKAVPSPRQPEPGSTVYYRGGYTVQTHGSRDGGNVDAIQLEFPGEVISDDTRRPTFAAKIGDVLTNFHETYY